MKLTIPLLVFALFTPLFLEAQSDTHVIVRTKEDTLRILERAKVYKDALACQKKVIDSLRSLYEIRLWSYQEEVWFGLTDNQKRIINRLYKTSIKNLEWKKQQFLDYEENASKDIPPAMYDYMEYGFNLMKEFPSSAYFNLLGTDLSALSFLDTFGFDPYFRLYDEFELALTDRLRHEDCRAHMAIPFYHQQDSEEVERKHRRRNALFYLVKDVPAPADSMDQGKRIDPPIINVADCHFSDSPYSTADFIDLQKINELNLVPFELMDEVGLKTYTQPYEGNDIQLMLGFLYQNSGEQKKELVNEFIRNHQHDQLNEIPVKDGKAVFVTKREEDLHTLKVTGMTDGILLIGNEVLVFYYYRAPSIDIPVVEILKIIELPARKK